MDALIFRHKNVRKDETFTQMETSILEVLDERYLLSGERTGERSPASQNYMLNTMDVEIEVAQKD